MSVFSCVADIFGRLNELYLSMRGSTNSVLTVVNKIDGSQELAKWIETAVVGCSERHNTCCGEWRMWLSW